MQGWFEEEPLIVASASGCELVDVQGRRYLDGISALWCNVHGYRVPAIDAAIRAQLDQVAHTTLLGQSNVPAIELAARLAALTGLPRVFYSDSGSTAVEIALKMAFQFWQQSGQPQRQRFAALSEAYHGDTIGSVSVGGIDLFHRIFGPLLFSRTLLPSPYTYRPPPGHTAESWSEQCIAEAEAIIAAQAHTLAAVVIEPKIQGAAGMILQPPGYLARIAAICRAHDVLLICDEVATGFGRTGTMFAVEQEGVIPDFLCLAKGLTGGYLPLAATLTTERVFAAFLGSFESRRTFFHGHTFTGNPLACAAALASLDCFANDHVLTQLPAKIQRLRDGLAPLAHHPHVGELRQCGMMVGIELVADKTTKTAYDTALRVGHQVILRARAHGLVLRPLGDVIVLMPALAMSHTELDALCAITTRAITEATCGGSS